MNQPPYYIPVVVRENAKQKAFTLIGEGYVQAHEVLQCPHCAVKYLFLCDDRDSGRNHFNPQKRQEALRYFAGKIREGHQGGHSEDIMVFPFERHLAASASAFAGMPDMSERKAS